MMEENIKKIGYLSGYFIFTTILYLMLKISKKMPNNWNYFYLMGITLIIVIIGILLKKNLK